MTQFFIRGPPASSLDEVAKLVTPRLEEGISRRYRGMEESASLEAVNAAIRDNRPEVLLRNLASAEPLLETFVNEGRKVSRIGCELPPESLDRSISREFPEPLVELARLVRKGEGVVIGRERTPSMEALSEQARKALENRMMGRLAKSGLDGPATQDFLRRLLREGIRGLSVDDPVARQIALCLSFAGGLGVICKAANEARLDASICPAGFSEAGTLVIADWRAIEGAVLRKDLDYFRGRIEAKMKRMKPQIGEEAARVGRTGSLPEILLTASAPADLVGFEDEREVFVRYLLAAAQVSTPRGNGRSRGRAHLLQGPELEKLERQCEDLLGGRFDAKALFMVTRTMADPAKGEAVLGWFVGEGNSEETKSARRLAALLEEARRGRGSAILLEI